MDPRNKPTPSRKRSGLSFIFGLRRLQRQALIAWARFARRHRESHWLPIGLFAFLYLDGFLIVLPSMIALIVSVTISPKRWALFATIFVVAFLLNHLTLYVLGRTLPMSLLLQGVEFMGLRAVWNSALEAVADYGKYATFIGAFFSMPTQVIALMMGMADANAKFLNGDLQKASIESALLFAGVGHGIKAYGVALIVRYGWTKFEKKVEDEIVQKEKPKNL